MSEEDEEPQELSLCLNSQPEEQERETRSVGSEANDNHRGSGLKGSSNVKDTELLIIPLGSTLYTLNKIRMYYHGSKTASEKI